MLVCLVLESFSLEVVLSGHQDLVHKLPGCEIGLVVTVSIQPQKSANPVCAASDNHKCSKSGSRRRMQSRDGGSNTSNVSGSRNNSGRRVADLAKATKGGVGGGRCNELSQ